jgi:hypothetical protein
MARIRKEEERRFRLSGCNNKQQQQEEDILSKVKVREIT